VPDDTSVTEESSESAGENDMRIGIPAILLSPLGGRAPSLGSASVEADGAFFAMATAGLPVNLET
jgi:hypothetical protein